MTGLAGGITSGFPVLERLDHPGGICASYERDGYHFELGTTCGRSEIAPQDAYKSPMAGLSKRVTGSIFLTAGSGSTASATTRTSIHCSCRTGAETLLSAGRST